MTTLSDRKEINLVSAPRPTSRGTDRDPLRGPTRGSVGNRTLTAAAGLTLPSPNDGDLHVFAIGFAR